MLGVDFNGVHALSGLLLFLPAFYFALRPKWALYYAIYVAIALWVTGIWALFDEQPAWVFTFPNNEADAMFHLATGTVFALSPWSRSPATAAPSASDALDRHRRPGITRPRRGRWCRRRAGRGRG